jgi:hypothetical protein
MRKLLIPSALAVALVAAAGSAFASSDETRVNVPRDQWLTIPQITEKFTAQGYDVRQVKVEKGGYEVYAIGKDGNRLEVYVHPATGEILGSEAEED